MSSSSPAVTEGGTRLEPLPLEPLGDLAVPIGAFIDF